MVPHFQEFYKNGGQSNPCVTTPVIEEHHASDAGVSLTESGMCEMSRQASNTESTENPTELAPYGILDELVKLSTEESETMSEVSEDTLGRSNSNSDSTEHAQSEAGDFSDGVSPPVIAPERESECGIEGQCSRVKQECERPNTTSSDVKSEMCESCVNAATETSGKGQQGGNIFGDLGSPRSEVVEFSSNIINICDTQGSKVLEVMSDDCQETDYEFDMPPEALPSVS